MAASIRRLMQSCWSWPLPLPLLLPLSASAAASRSSSSSFFVSLETRASMEKAKISKARQILKKYIFQFFCKYVKNIQKIQQSYFLNIFEVFAKIWKMYFFSISGVFALLCWFRPSPRTRASQREPPVYWFVAVRLSSRRLLAHHVNLLSRSKSQFLIGNASHYM